MSKGIQLLTINITEDNHVQKNKPTLQANLDKRADKLWTTNQAMHHARRSTHPSCKGKQSNIIEEEEHIHNAWGNTHPLCKRKHPSIMQEKHTTIMQEKHTTIMQEEAYIHYARGSIYTLCKKKHPPIMQEEAHTMRDSPIFNHTANSVHCTVLCRVYEYICWFIIWIGIWFHFLLFGWQFAWAAFLLGIAGFYPAPGVTLWWGGDFPMLQG